MGKLKILHTIKKISLLVADESSKMMKCVSPIPSVCC